MNAFFKFLAPVFALNLLSPSVFADPPLPTHNHWRNTNYPSHYVLYDAASKSYIETINCKPTYYFKFLTRELNAMTLFDQSRNMTIRLDYDGMSLKASGASSFTFYQSGTFDSRLQFENRNPNGTVASVISKGHNCDWKEWFVGAPSPTFYFVEKGTNNDAVEIFDGSRNMWVRMTSNAMFLKVGNGAYSFFHSGNWR